MSFKVSNGGGGCDLGVIVEKILAPKKEYYLELYEAWLVPRQKINKRKGEVGWGCN